MGYLQIFSQGIQRKRRTHQIGQSDRQVFDQADILDIFQGGQIPLNNPGPIFPAPPAAHFLGLERKRFRKPAVDKKILKHRQGSNSQFGAGERKQPVKMISPLQRITAATIIVEAGASGDQYLKCIASGIEQPFHHLTPSRIFVDLIQDQRSQARRKSLANKIFPVIGRIPVDIPFGCINPPLGTEMLVQHCFPRLPRAHDKDHIPLDILGDAPLDIS